MSKYKNVSGTKSARDARRIRRVAAAVVPLIFLSVFLGAFTVSVANDMYAFIKSDSASVLNLSADLSIFGVASRLEQEGIINNPLAFTLYARAKGAEQRITQFSGEIYLSASMSYREIISAFS